MRNHGGWVILLGWLTCVPAAGALEFPQVEGFALSGESQRFDAGTIWQAIDGAAELYLSYDLQSLTVQEYRQGDTRISINVFDQGEAINAWGIFRRQRPSGAGRLDVPGDALSAPPYTCVLRKAHFFVKVEPARGQLDVSTCRSLLKSLAPVLEGQEMDLSLLDRLPAADRVEGSEGYTRRSFLGLSELQNCLHAEYRPAKGGEPFLLFSILPGPGEKIEDAWKRLAAKWKPVRAGESEALHRTVPYRGEVVVVKSPDGLLGAADAGDLEATRALLDRALHGGQR